MARAMSILLCQSCGWKEVCELDRSVAVEIKNDSMSSRKFRCPSCGRGVVPRSFPDPQRELDLKSKDERIKSEMDEWTERSLDFQKRFLEDDDGSEDNDQGH